MKMMKRTLIFYKPEYADLAVKLRDHYRAHGHEKANIISEEEQDDVEYAREMQYDEAIFIEDRDTVTVHDLRSGSTNRLPVHVFHWVTAASATLTFSAHLHPSTPPWH